MSEIVFKPKHNWLTIVFLGLLIAAFGGAFLLGWYARNDKTLLVIGLVFIVMGFYSIARRSTVIIIGTTEVVMKRVLLPNLILDYDNFTDFIGSAFLFGNKGIPLDDMTNAQEFLEVFVPILEMKNIKQTGKYAADVARTSKSLKYAVIPSGVLSILAVYVLDKYFKIQYDRGLIYPAIFLVLLFGTYFILLKLEGNKKE